jgi:bifunctional hydroxylase/dehydrase
VRQKRVAGNDVDVVVVGAGPTGLMLAGELRLAGVSVTVIEKLTEPASQSRALGFSARAIEEFSQRGLLPDFGEVQTIPVGHFGGMEFDFRVIEGGSYGARGVPQSRTTAILASWAQGLGARVCAGHELVGLEAGGDGVEVLASTPRGPRRLRASYLVGCDGAHSAVRRLAGIGFPGTEPVVEMVLADVTGVSLRPRFTGERLPGGMVMVLPAGPQVTRIGLYERAAGIRFTSTAPTFADVADGWERVTGQDIHDATPLWVSSFTDASRQASEYRRGRVLVAGDAAHVHLPQGAQGMSAGIGDAVNLGWKLAAEVRGYAPPGLLDSYHTERHPVGARIIANTLAQRILYLGGQELDAVREVFAELLSYPAVQHHLAGMVTGLGIRYDAGPGEHPLLGRRLPDHDLVRQPAETGKTTAFAQLHAGRAVVFDLAGDPRVAVAAAPWGDRVDVVTASPCDGGPRELADAAAVLVRPDGYVAWVATPGGGPDGLTQALASWFGAPLPRG